MLAVGATWDAELARAYGAALGREFRVKGANVYLGPGVNVHRVARNGRNGEYISGEGTMWKEIDAAASAACPRPALSPHGAARLSAPSGSHTRAARLYPARPPHPRRGA